MELPSLLAVFVIQENRNCGEEKKVRSRSISRPMSIRQLEMTVSDHNILLLQGQRLKINCLVGVVDDLR
jgi:hypothetical protein